MAKTTLETPRNSKANFRILLADKSILTYKDIQAIFDLRRKLRPLRWLCIALSPATLS